MTISIYTNTPTSDRQTWQSLLFGITAWFLDLNLVYSLPSLACHWGWFPFTVVGLPGLKFIQLIATAVAAVLLMVLIYLPWRNWRPFWRDNAQVMQQTEADRRPLIAYVTMLLNTLSLLFVLASVVPILALNPCVSGGG
jgi:uncharacterized membrane protein